MNPITTYMFSKFTLVFILFSVFSVSLFSQDKLEIDLKISKSEFETADEENFKNAWDKVKAGNQFFEEGIGTFPDALNNYLDAWEYNPEHPVLNYFIGICYIYSDEKYKAVEYLRKAYERNAELHEDIEFYLGKAYHFLMEFDKAEEFYKKFRDRKLAENEVDEVVRMDKLLMEIESGRKLLASPQRVVITNMGENINSEADDYFSVLSNNDSLMYFTSRRYHEKRNKRNPYDNKFYEDIYTSRLEAGNQWSPAVPLTDRINNKQNNAAVGVSPDGTELYIYNGSVNGGDIFLSRYDSAKAQWEKPKPLPGKLRSTEAEGAVYFSPASDTMYFISADKNFSEGGKDIFYAVKNEKGDWSKPFNLGSLINSEYDEEGIYVTPNGKELYFSSKGHNTMGGYDIFRSLKLEDGSWSDPENLGYPLNTPEDELFYSIPADGSCAFYTTIREGGRGGKDIYKINTLGTEKKLELAISDEIYQDKSDSVKTGFFTQPEKTSSMYSVRGRITDRESGKPLSGKLEIIDVSNSKIIATTISSADGSYSVKLASPSNYGVEILVKDYMVQLEEIDLTNASSDKPLVRNFELDKIRVGVKLVLENIYFNSGRSTLKKESFVQLDQIFDLLENNSTLRLEISGHTDNTGSLEINRRLSGNRAKAVVDYLVSKGISSARLEWKGYAFTQPVATNSTPEGRAKNRRVEMKILSK